MNYEVGLISIFMEKPTTSHLILATIFFSLIRSVKGTCSLGMLFARNQKTHEYELFGYFDLDWSKDKSDRKSIVAYVFIYGNETISWCSNKEDVVVLYSCEVEYIASSLASCQVQWLSMLMQEMNLNKDVSNKSSINLTKRPIAHGRIKDREIRFHFLRDQANKEKLDLQHCMTTFNFQTC